jgi:predicted nucleic acid-binding protein
MDKLLIDTDVLLDFFFDRQPYSYHAAKLIDLCAKKEVMGYTTPLIIANVYYLLRKTAKHAIIVEKIKQLLAFIEIVPMEKQAVMNALNSAFKDFEDALQNFSAAEYEGGIRIIVTRNLKDFKRSELAVMTPETYLKGRGTE